MTSFQKQKMSRPQKEFKMKISSQNFFNYFFDGVLFRRIMYDTLVDDLMQS
ncbi:hypothetical protein FD12_GL000026 [Lentilactobacillus rapi DSM 19907 = JCM 15042]|uniref:Uncharacterized protein n=1 Tax=Lentilactobacillus rapi DSM 19907 = JCM 15042 TaxID=1423795 RepID=A0ABR5PG26_9LACO|nr:hypothetical protein FD12_GL000026 [Lentilactobacillus rapi DSM 19907 = JCM 15042]